MSKEIYEIERKFLVKEIPNNLQQYNCSSVIGNSYSSFFIIPLLFTVNIYSSSLCLNLIVGFVDIYPCFIL